VERFSDPEPGVLYPRLIEVSGRGLPEDCGGRWGYAELMGPHKTMRADFGIQSRS